MNTLDIVRLNLLSPMILAFALGLVAAAIRSDLKFPDELYTALTIYLLFSIGLKGGAELAHTSLAQFWPAALLTLALGLSIPLWSYLILRRLGRLDIANAAALAATYGSVSAVTFSAAQTFLERIQVPYEGFAPTLVALLEAPAIILALFIAQTALTRQAQANPVEAGKDWTTGRGHLRETLRELVTSKSIVLLVGGLVIGYLSGPEGVKQVANVFIDPFKGVLTLFLLELGMVTARRLRDFRQVGGFLLGFGLIMPLIHAALAIGLGRWVGLSLGGQVILGVLAASASYIAAPAAVRVALPQANPGLYLTAALAITFPFNLVVGLPLYLAFARWLNGG